MNNLSRKMSYILRHGILKTDIEMDPAGWVSFEDLVKYLRVNQKDVLECVRHDNKQRFEVNYFELIYPITIRACQGHSNDMPVTRDALEESWAIFNGTQPIWHTTNARAFKSIQANGLVAGQRTHVHMAPHRDSKVGKRQSASDSIVLEIEPSKLRKVEKIYQSSNGVVLSRSVPSECIIRVW
jgi:putative RNA 2'-phosphotransferase